MATYTLFEHKVTQDFEPTAHDLASLAKLKKATGVDILIPVVRANRIVLKATQYVGVVRLGHHSLQILPKIYPAVPDATPEQNIKDATRNLLYLLAYAGQLPIREQDIAPLLREGRDWFEVLTHLFATNLLREWRLGAFRSYQSADDELPLLKGKWRINDQLRRPERRHRFAVTYDEFTADNALNRVLRFVVERLWILTRDSENRQILGTLRQWMEEDVTLPSVVTTAEAAAIVLTRQNTRYAPLLNLARLFLNGGSLQIASGDLSTFAFVFDMNQLFEAFIFNFIRRHREEVLPLSLQNSEMLAQSKGTKHYLARNDNGNQLFHLKPDIAFRQQVKFLLLLDTKYKELVPKHRRLGVSPADIYQMHAYAHRFNCSRILLLYPQTTGTGDIPLTRFTLEASGGKVIAAATVNLQVQLSDPTVQANLARSLHNLLDELMADSFVEIQVH